MILRPEQIVLIKIRGVCKFNCAGLDPIRKVKFARRNFIALRQGAFDLRVRGELNLRGEF